MTTLRDVFEAHVIRGEDCWGWTGQPGGSGYHSLRFGGKRLYAHRVSHELFKGPIPEGFDIDHLCRNPECVNPDHLEAVTHRENCRRGLRGDLHTHCPKGHPKVPANRYYRKDGSSQCAPCARERECSRRNQAA